MRSRHLLLRSSQLRLGPERAQKAPTTTGGNSGSCPMHPNSRHNATECHEIIELAKRGHAGSVWPPSPQHLVRPPGRRLQCWPLDQRSPVPRRWPGRGFGVGASNHGHNHGQHHYHRLWASSLSVVVAQLPPQPPGTGLPLTLNMVVSTGNNSASGNPVLQLANSGGLLDACVKAKEPSSLSPYGGDVVAIKAKIVSRPHYYSLLTAYLTWNKVGAPPEVSAKLTKIVQEVEARQHTALGGLAAATELDQFMEAYHEMLVKFREELTRLLQEAMEFIRRVESQLNSLSISGRSLRNILSSGAAVEDREGDFLNQCSGIEAPRVWLGETIWRGGREQYAHAAACATLIMTRALPRK
ncbi:homeotic protein knotted-1-like [Zea mays]|uniref:homeotic protein knotted-1-like n=1 Tax=Zea mays TaxID=4577 RepID=UPI0009A974ED|nr:homeotic protein knotted-1-like [Zea mays]|eukprot:XP_020407755.1 homeotic protein knotted-1-like [Zea mays]